jgi:alpha-D-xyloside xylohydrolase
MPVENQNVEIRDRTTAYGWAAHTSGPGGGEEPRLKNAGQCNNGFGSLSSYDQIFPRAVKFTACFLALIAKTWPSMQFKRSSLTATVSMIERGREKLLIGTLAVMATVLLPACRTTMAVSGVQKQSDGVVLTTSAGVTRLQVWSDRIIRVTFAPGTKLPATESLCVIANPAPTKWSLSETASAVVLQTDALQARVDRKTGAVGFYDLKGNPMLQELAEGAGLQPEAGASVARRSFALAPNEAIYGLGQHQNGVWNYRGTVVHLQQRNMEVAIPVLVSSKGYGVLWDNPAITDVDAGKACPGVLSWNSETGKAVDYYFLFGPTADDVIRDYRTLTGAAPMMGRWLWGFWQCKEHYASQEELTNVVAEYRKRGVPLDGIVQDWQYWPKRSWGSHEFDPARYPDPAGMIRDLHAMHAHVMISVWAKFDVGTSNFNELKRAGALYSQLIPGFSFFDPTETNKYYDPFNPAAREMYWGQMNNDLFKLGIDGWWLDASEPELGIHWGEFRQYQTAMGPGSNVFNAFPLMHTTAVYQGQRAATSAKRVAILTRSAWAGQQRNAAITWSGDIKGRWDVFARQIPAGLNFSLSGIPYWNTDIGGFFGRQTSDKDYQELFTRWFQFGAFCPLFRVHGTTAPKELWRWDEPTQKIWEKFVDLRYRLLPYIYSVSWQVTSGGTMMRPLMMDFADDPRSLEIGDQYLFGPAMMICPVTQPGATHREVYLPGQQGWYDFWTGATLAGGQSVEAAAPIDSMPLFVRAGAIVPMGPVGQYAAEQTGKPLEIRVYRGADGTFTLYDDEGDNYDYEKGEYSTISLTWNDSKGTLVIGPRRGEFPGMINEQTFRIVFVSDGHGSGVAETESPDAVVKYTGQPMIVKAEP